MPKVSVITTFRNAAPFLAGALESVSAQSFGDFEHILINDGSVDGWREVIEACADPRQKLLSLYPGVGRVAALNAALAAAVGEYVAILDADDATSPRRLERQAAFLDAEPHVVLVGTHCRYVDAKGREQGFFRPPDRAGAVRQAMAYFNPVAHSSVMYRRLAAGKGYPEDFPYAHDFALYLDLLDRGDIVNLPEVLVEVAIHEGQMRMNPGLAVARLHDEMRCFERAGSMDGLSRTARKKGRRARMYVGIRHARALMRAGQAGEGRARLLSLFFSSPWLFLRALWVNPDLRTFAVPWG